MREARARHHGPGLAGRSGAIPRGAGIAALLRLAVSDCRRIAQRTAMFAAERTRRSSLAAAAEPRGLAAIARHQRYASSRCTTSNLDRAAQLFNKTNQMNHRHTPPVEGRARSVGGGAGQSTAHVPRRRPLRRLRADRDRRSQHRRSWRTRRAPSSTFSWSCRVIGRNVEDAMLHVAIAQCRARRGVDVTQSRSRRRRATSRALDLLPALRSGAPPATTCSCGMRTQPYLCPGWVMVTDEAGVVTTADS